MQHNAKKEIDTAESGGIVSGVVSSFLYVFFFLNMFSILLISFDLIIETEQKPFVTETLPRKLETQSANTLNRLSSYTGEMSTKPLFSQIVLSGATNSLFEITEGIHFNGPRVYLRPTAELLASYIGWWKRADDNIVIDTNLYIPSIQQHRSLYDSAVLKLVATSVKEQLETMTNMNMMNAEIAGGYFQIDMMDFPASRPWWKASTTYGHDFHKDGSSDVIPRQMAERIELMKAELLKTKNELSLKANFDILQQHREATNGYYMTMTYPKGVQTSMFRHSHGNGSYTDIKNINTNQSIYMFNQNNIEHSLVTNIDYRRRCLIGRFFEDANHWMLVHRPAEKLLVNWR